MSRISCANLSNAGLIWQPKDPHVPATPIAPWDKLPTTLLSAATAAASMASVKYAAGTLRTRLFETGRLPREDVALPSLALAHATLPPGWPRDDGDQRVALFGLCDHVERSLGLEADASDVLILGGADAASVSALYFRGHAAARAAISAMAQAIGQPDRKSARLHIALGRHPDLVELWVIDTFGGMAKDMRALADGLLDTLLTANRPVAAWRAQYFMPVTAPASALGKGWMPAPAPGAAERNYFLEAANRVIGKGEGAMESLDYAITPEPLTLTLTSPACTDPALAAPLIALRLHRFGDAARTALIEWVVEVDSARPAVPVLWQRYLEDGGSGWSLARVLDFHAGARFIKHHYQRDEALTLCGKTMDHAGGQTMLDLLRTIAPLAGAELVENGRDRAFAFASVILDGGPDSDGALDPLQASLACVDPYAPSGFYDNGFAQDEYRASQYRRFWSTGTRFFATSHSFAMLGFRQDHDAIARGGTGFAESPVHALHMPAMYRRMFQLCLFQQLALDDVGGGLSKHADWSGREAELGSLRRLWIDLRAARWFTRVSTELQGEELYAHLRKAQQIDDDADVLDRKLADLEGIYELAREKARKRREQFLEFVGLPVGIFLVFREMMYTGLNEYPEAPAYLFEGMMKGADLKNPFFALVALSLGVALIAQLVRGWTQVCDACTSRSLRGNKRAQALLWTLAFVLVAVILARQVDKFKPDTATHGLIIAADKNTGALPPKPGTAAAPTKPTPPPMPRHRE